MSSWLSEREQMLVEGAEKNNLDLTSTYANSI